MLEQTTIINVSVEEFFPAFQRKEKTNFYLSIDKGSLESQK